MTRNEQVLTYLVQACSGRLGRTQLVKLMYLMDYEAYRYLGRPITEFEWKTDNYGPFDRDFFAVLGHLQEEGFIAEEAYPTPFGNVGYRYHSRRPTAYELSLADRRIVNFVVETYAKMAREALVDDVVYQTEPFLAVKDEGNGVEMRWDTVENQRKEALGNVDLEEVERAKQDLRAGKGVPLAVLLDVLRGNAVDAAAQR
jgi:hypothetical protein